MVVESLQQRMTADILPALKKELGLKNVHSVPKVEKIKVQVGIGSMAKNIKDFSEIEQNIAKITGQKPIITKAKKAVSNFKLRAGMPVGIVVTLRGQKMYSFMDRLINVVLPRVRDFRGLNPKAFDGHGNYNIGLREALVFPEINPDNVQNVHGLQINVVTTAENDDDGYALLKSIGFPIKPPQQAVKADEPANS